MKTPGFNRNQVKYLVIIAMLTDHIAWAFVPMESVPGQIMHFTRRFTGPAMACFRAVKKSLPCISENKFFMRCSLMCRDSRLSSQPLYNYLISALSGVIWMNSPALRRAGRSAR